MAIDYSLFKFSKGPTKLQDRILYKRTREQQERTFKAAVWKRDGGRCRACRRVVVKSLEPAPNRGEVHHKRGRNVAPDKRFSVADAVLLCAQCHEQVQRGKVKIPQR